MIKKWRPVCHCGEYVDDHNVWSGHTAVEMVPPKEIRYLDYTWAANIVAHQDNFPKEMRELDIQVWIDVLNSTPYSIGYFIDGNLVGWRIFKRESEKVIYVAELLVLPEYRGQGIAKELIRESLVKPRQSEESIHSFLRVGAYRVVFDEEMIAAAGYKIIINIFIDNHYNDRFGIHEDAYELLIVPDESWFEPVVIYGEGE